MQLSLTSAAVDAGPAGGDVARGVLHAVFGYREFRPGQADAVAAVLAGRDAAVLLPTGAGKSLCYQVPAIAAFRAERGTTVVISPLIALMNDQVAALVGRGIPCAALHSQQEDDVQAEAIEDFLGGGLALLYVSPERAALPSFRRLLARVPVALLAVDESHCLSQWGHDFRPEYLRLHELRPLLPGVPVIALTATATPRVMDEIVAELRLRDPAIVRGDFRRPNLRFEVQHCGSDDARHAAVLAACDALALRSRHGTGRAIIYCATRKKTEAVAAALRSAGFPAAHYHAGRTALARDRAHTAFSRGRTRILVATSAFGMGIDYGDVRLLVHFQAPGSLEAYYQEAGRAGRDGDPARCLLLFGPGDLVLQRRLGASDPRTDASLAAIDHYAHAAACRQSLLCAHFTGTDDHPPCHACDFCTDPSSLSTPAPAAPRPARTPRTPRTPRAPRARSDRAARARSSFATSEIARELDRYRKRKARELKWKTYMVFQQRTIVALDTQRPTTLDALHRIPGLGPAKIDRFGPDILAAIARHADR